MIVNAISNDKDERALSSNDMEKVLELQNSVLMRRRIPNFGYPDYSYGAGLNLFSEDHDTSPNVETVLEQQKLIQNLLKHYQSTLIEESPWLGASSLLRSSYQKRYESDVSCDEDGRLTKDEVRKRIKRDEEGKVFAKQRKTNFTAKEVEALLNCVADQKEVILFGVAGGKGWAKAWQEIAKVVTKVEGIDRTEGDVRKKWTYLKWEAKNTSKPGRDPVSKQVLNILTSRDREVAEAMNLRDSSSSSAFPKEVPPVGLMSQGQTPGTPPLPQLIKQPASPVQQQHSQKKQHVPHHSSPATPKLDIQKQSAKLTPKPQPPAEVCLRWNSYHSNMQNTFPSLLNNEQFVDVTLACDGRSIKCHKVMLSACSPYMEELLSSNPCQHPIIFLKDMKFWQLAALVDFMYRGEVNVTQDKLPSLLSAAEALQIKGLASPVHPTTPPRHLHDDSDNVSFLRQFQPDMRTEPDDEYLQDTDEEPPIVSKPKKRKLSDGGSSVTQSQNALAKKHTEKKRNNLSSTPTSSSVVKLDHHSKQPCHPVSDSDQEQDRENKAFNSEGNQSNGNQNEELNIDEEQAQMILERYTQKDDNFSQDGDDNSNESG